MTIDYRSWREREREAGQGRETGREGQRERGRRVKREKRNASQISGEDIWHRDQKSPLGSLCRVQSFRVNIFIQTIFNWIFLGIPMS